MVIVLRSLFHTCLQAVRLKDVGPFPLTVWSHCTRGVRVNCGGDGSHGVSHGVITLFLHLNLSLHVHRCINHLVNELDLVHLHHLLNSLDKGNLSLHQTLEKGASGSSFFQSHVGPAILTSEGSSQVHDLLLLNITSAP